MSGIKLVLKSTLLNFLKHAHLAGIDLYTNIIRDGVDVGYLYKNKHFEIRLQTQIYFDPPVAITSVG